MHGHDLRGHGCPMMKKVKRSINGSYKENEFGEALSAIRGHVQDFDKTDKNSRFSLSWLYFSSARADGSNFQRIHGLFYVSKQD